MKTTANINKLKPGGFVLIDDVPCRVEKVQSSSSGKHGHAKVRLTAVGLVDEKKRITVMPGHDNVDVPIVEKKIAQVLSIQDDVANVMDSVSYETYDIEVPEEHLENIEPGKEAEVMHCMGKKRFERVK